MKKIIREVIPYVIVALIAYTIKIFIVTPAIVSGDSMQPTLTDNQVVLQNNFDYRINKIERFDIVVININKKKIIKRVIGLPGETVEYRNNALYIDGHEFVNDYNFDTSDFSLKDICNCDEIPNDKYLVLGDNRTISADSRIYGLIDKLDIEGSVAFSLWPIKKIN